MIPAELILKKNKLSMPTLQRLGAGLKLWKNGNYDKILLTGGRFLRPDIQTVPAAELMADWLTRNGVPRDKLIIENESVDTYENVMLGTYLLEMSGAGCDDVTIVSHPTHLRRLRLTFLAWTNGIEPHLHAASYPIGFLSWCKEACMYLLYRWDAFGLNWVAFKHRRRRYMAASRS